MFSIVSVILSAGSSRRMGSPKALLEIAGQTFLKHIVMVHRRLELQVCVVLSADDRLIQEQARGLEVEILQNPCPEKGPLSSLQLALQRHARSSALLVHPVDHPLVTSATLGRLIKTHRASPACILIPRIEGRKGHPVLFPYRFYPDLRVAPLNEGARHVVHQNHSSCLQVEVTDRGVLANLNTPQELHRWL